VFILIGLSYNGNGQDHPGLYEVTSCYVNIDDWDRFLDGEAKRAKLALDTPMAV